MSPQLASFFSDFAGGVEFIFTPRESVGGGVQVGGLGEIGDLLVDHLLVSGAAMAIACAVAIPLGLWLGHLGRGEFIAVTISNVGRAVPSLALLAFFIAFLGIGFTNVTAVLVLLALPPILTNAYVGARQVDPEIVDAARGMGMSARQIVSRVRVPLALPTIFAGVRTSAVSVLATATIAPLANVQTLGEPIINPQTYGFEGGLGAAIVVGVITIAADAGIGVAQHAVTPEGIKLAEGDGRRRLRLALPTRRREAAT